MTKTSRKPIMHTRKTACETIARDLRTFGYPGVTGDIIEEILTAWLAGNRDSGLPRGVVGMFAGRQFDEIESARPGALAALK